MTAGKWPFVRIDMLKKVLSSGKQLKKASSMAADVVTPSTTISRRDPDFRTPLPDIKGQRRDPDDLYSGLPATKVTTEMRYRLGHLHTLHPRSVRVKTWLSLLGFLGWYVGIFAFIAARLGSDDLDTLEKEARAQMDLRKKIKADFLDKD